MEVCGLDRIGLGRDLRWVRMRERRGEGNQGRCWW